MKINPIEPIKQIEKAKRTSAIDKKPVADPIEDKVSISGDAKAIEKAIQAAVSANVDKADRVDALRREIQSNGYTVDAAKVADKIAETAAGSDNKI